MSVDLEIKLLLGGFECAVTIARPVIDTVCVVRSHKKISALIISIALCTIIALTLCSHYVKTKPILALNHTFSEISYFLKNPIHAGLLGGIGGIVYLIIGRELINKSKLRYGWEASNPCPFHLIGGKLPDLSSACSPIYKQRYDKAEEEQLEFEDDLSKTQKMKIGVATLLATLTAPIVTPIHKYPKTAIITSLAIIIVSICAHYVHTRPMQNFTQALSKAYHATATFLSNRTNAALIGIMGTIFYLGVGREVVHQNKIDFVWDTRFFPNKVWDHSELKQLATLWGFGDRSRLLREIEYDTNFFRKKGYFGNVMDPTWKRFQECSNKVQKEGTFYLHSEESYVFFVHGYDNVIRFHPLEMNQEFPDPHFNLEYRQIMRSLTCCGYKQVL